MKKLLSILASVSLIATSSSAVVACADQSAQKTKDVFVNNSLNNILGASLEKAKQVIMNNEYGISTKNVNAIQSDINSKVVNDGLSNIDYADLSDKKNTTVGQLVSQYYGSDNNNSNTESGSGIDLSGNNGQSSTIDYILQKLMDALKIPPFFQNAIRRYKGLIFDGLNMFKETVNMSSLDDMNHDMYNQAIGGGEYLLNTGIQLGLNALQAKIIEENKGDKPDSQPFHMVAKVIKGFVDNKNKLGDETLPGIFGGKTFNLIRTVAGQLMNGQSSSTATKTFDATQNGSTPSPIQNAIYQNSDLTLNNFLGDADKNPTVKLSTYFFSFDSVSKGWNADDKLANVNVTDIHKELLSSIDRILRTIINPSLLITGQTHADIKLAEFDDTKSDYNSDFNNDLQDLISKIVGGLITKQIDTKSLFNPNLMKDQASIMGLAWEALRDISLMNAQFSMFENAYDIQATDSQHLFGNDANGDAQTNYQFLNGLVNDVKVDGKKEIPAKYKTLADTPFLKAGDEPININYFFSNLNYYLGNLSSKDDASVYRVQKLLFILFNDPAKSMMADGSTASTGWTDKQSDLLDFLIQTGVKVGTAYVDAKDMSATGSDKKTYDAIKSALATITPADISTLEDMLLKPFILGLINGNSFQPLIEILDGGLHGAMKIDSVAKLFNSLKPLGINIDDIMKTIDRIANNNKIGNDTIHSLFTVDFRNILKPLKIIPQEWMDKLFGPDLPVNLYTLANMSLSKILSMLGVSGFQGGKISPIGDYFTLHSIPWLVNFMNDDVLNNVSDTSDVPEKYAVYTTDKDGKQTGVMDYTKSLKARDINFQGIYDLLISIIGTNDSGTYKGPSDNILSRLIHDLVETNDDGLKDDYSNIGTAVSIQLDPSKTVHDLGFMKQVAKEGATPSTNSVTLDSTDASTLPDGKYDDSAKTIEFDSGNITSAWKLNQPAPIAVSSTDISAGKIVLHLQSSIEEAKPHDLTFSFTTDKDATVTGKVTIPALFGGAGTDLQIQYNSIAGAFYRLNLPKIEQDQPDTDGTKTFTMHDRFLDVDLLKTNYTNFINLLEDFNIPGDYLSFIKNILRNHEAFELEYDPKNIKYFATNRKIVKGLTFTVTYKNYVVGETNQYIFTVSRDSNIGVFNIDKIITNKID